MWYKRCELSNQSTLDYPFFRIIGGWESDRSGVIKTSLNTLERLMIK